MTNVRYYASLKQLVAATLLSVSRGFQLVATTLLSVSRGFQSAATTLLFASRGFQSAAATLLFVSRGFRLRTEQPGIYARHAPLKGGATNKELAWVGDGGTANCKRTKPTLLGYY